LLGLFFCAKFRLCNSHTKIIKLSASPKFLNSSQTPLNHLCHVHLEKLNVDVTVFFKTVKRQELEVELANYHTELNNHYLGVLDGFFSLIQGRPIEAIDRFPIKELDYYLRDNNDVSAFSGYSQEIYEILSLGESMKTLIYGEKKIGFQFDPKTDGHFFDLSTSEQYDLLEEFFAYYVYPYKEFPDVIEIIEITENEVILNIENEKITKLIKEKLFLV
jgi:hypothetical protein